MQRNGQDITARHRRRLLQQRRQALLRRRAATPNMPAPRLSHRASPQPSTRRSSPRNTAQLASVSPRRGRSADRRVHPGRVRSLGTVGRAPAPSDGLLSATRSPIRKRRSKRHRTTSTTMLPQVVTARPLPQRPRRAQRARPQQRQTGRQLLYLGRLLIAGLGIGGIAGTLLMIVDPAPPAGIHLGGHSLLSRSGPEPGSSALNFDATLTTLGIQLASPEHPQQVALAQLKPKIQALATAQADLSPGLYFLNPETGAFLDMAGEASFPAASTIKVPVLVAFFQAVDAGEIQLDEPLVMRPDLMATEAGVMQYQPPGTPFSARETAEKMITISDNTATNMLIDRLGGAEALNRQFLAWGLTDTKIRNPLPDLEGTNTISPRDLTFLMLRLAEGDVLSLRSRDLALDILQRTVTNTLLPQGIAPEAKIAHKTGDIGSVVGDTGYIRVPNGQRYVATVMVKRPHNDPRAQELIRQISRLTYDVFSQPVEQVQQPVSE